MRCRIIDNMNGHILHGTNIAVDYWKIRGRGGNLVHFLTHLHGDHIVGLTSSWHKPIYCSEFTSQLLTSRHGLPSSLLRICALNQSMLISGPGSGQFTVTAMDANHCPGALMFYFQGDFGNILYTGDFRASPQLMDSCRHLATHIDTLYLDNTFCSPRCVFPSRGECLSMIVSVIQRHLQHHVLIGVRQLGKESLLAQLGVRLNETVCVSPACYHMSQMLFATDVFTTTALGSTARIRTVAMHTISRQLLHQLNNTQPTIAIIPSAIYTGLDCRPFIGDANIFVVPYSDHCSYVELMEFVSMLRPARVLPIVRQLRGPFGLDISDRADMACFQGVLLKGRPGNHIDRNSRRLSFRMVRETTQESNTDSMFLSQKSVQGDITATHNLCTQSMGRLEQMSRPCHRLRVRRCARGRKRSATGVVYSDCLADDSVSDYCNIADPTQHTDTTGSVTISHPTQHSHTTGSVTISHPTQHSHTTGSVTISHPTQHSHTTGSVTISHPTQHSHTTGSVTISHPTQHSHTTGSVTISHPTQHSHTIGSVTISHPTQQNSSLTSSASTSHPTQQSSSLTSSASTSHPTQQNSSLISSASTSHPTQQNSSLISSASTSHPTQQNSSLISSASTSHPTQQNSSLTSSDILAEFAAFDSVMIGNAVISGLCANIAQSLSGTVGAHEGQCTSIAQSLSGTVGAHEGQCASIAQSLSGTVGAHEGQCASIAQSLSGTVGAHEGQCASIAQSLGGTVGAHEGQELNMIGRSQVVKLPLYSQVRDGAKSSNFTSTSPQTATVNHGAKSSNFTSTSLYSQVRDGAKSSNFTSTSPQTATVNHETESSGIKCKQLKSSSEILREKCQIFESKNSGFGSVSHFIVSLREFLSKS